MVEASKYRVFEREWSSRAELFNTYLQTNVQELLIGAPARLSDAILYSLMAPGKRLRPLLVLWASEAVCGDFSPAMPAAAAVELIHCYSLVHDDLPAMDDDDLRRGRPTCHIQFDEATAILAGDAMQPMAFELLTKGNPSPEIAVKACRLLAKVAGPTALVGGQSDDLRAETEVGDSDLLASIHARKTAAMIRVSVELGGLLAGATQEQLKHLSVYGQAVGHMFQIVDDLLDVQGDATIVGKRTGKDFQRGKLTYPGFYGVEASIVAARDYTSKAIRALESFGKSGKTLIQLAEYILERKH
ncbi:MAG: farnesyl diphosphate synthase [Pirellulaceae bacterium]|nr:farnesyl diphosphate synthase [Pirellulaceae bacterium]